MGEFLFQEEYHNNLLAQQQAGKLKTREKPIVHYKSLGFEIKVGQRADVKTLDHPCEELNYAPFTHTSIVVKVEDNGDFESFYTKYVLVKD